MRWDIATILSRQGIAAIGRNFTCLCFPSPSVEEFRGGWKGCTA
jgi:hypothetical protein